MQASSSAGVSRLEARAFQLLYVLACVACVFPLFRVQYLPIQDLPQHLAAARVLHDYADPTLAFARYFELDLLRTQYLTIYLATHVLAYVVDVELAMRIVVAAALVATPLSLRLLLDALGKDTRLSLLAFPLAYNAHLVLGFVNFLAAIPLAFYAITLAIRQRAAFSRRRAIGLAVVAIACFYTHVVPFGLLCAGVCLVAFGRGAKRMARELAPLLPCVPVVVLWLHESAAGEATLRAAQGGSGLLYTPAKVALAELPRWLTDVLARKWDLWLLEAWAGLIALAFVLCLLGSRAQPDVTRPQRHAALGLLLPLCAGLYFIAPTGYDFIWPIAQRFALLSALMLIVVLPRLGPRGNRLIAMLALACSLASFHHAGSAFGAFSRKEVGDFEQALAVIPKGKRVAGLIYDRYSREIAFAPFIHYVAYYQAQKGGAVMFSFADFPQSPFRFREDDRPPRVRPRWEWTPERVRLSPDLDWYDYVLVRSVRPRFPRARDGFVPAYVGERWSVLARKTPR